MNETPPLTQLGILIRQARENARLSKTELGRRLGYERQPASMVAKWERGEQSFPIRRLNILLSTLDLDVDEVVRLIGQHLWGPLDDKLRAAIVRDQIVRAEESQGRTISDSEVQQILEQLSDDRRRRVEQTAFFLARQELEEQKQEAQGEGL